MGLFCHLRSGAFLEYRSEPPLSKKTQAKYVEWKSPRTGGVFWRCEAPGDRNTPFHVCLKGSLVEDSKHMKSVSKLIIQEGSGLPAIICL